MWLTPARRWRLWPRLNVGVAIRIHEAPVLSVPLRQKESAPPPRGAPKFGSKGQKIEPDAAHGVSTIRSVSLDNPDGI
jgi:hypothetical protein